MTWHGGEGASGAGTWPDLTRGTRVEHRHFGLGVVSGRDGGKVTIFFPEHFGTKVLNLAFTELRVLAEPEDDTAANGQDSPAVGPK